MIDNWRAKLQFITHGNVGIKHLWQEELFANIMRACVVEWIVSLDTRSAKHSFINTCSFKLI